MRGAATLLTITLRSTEITAADKQNRSEEDMGVIMFGKKTNNECFEDCIRLSEEYRAKCGTYDNEQRPYDEYNAVESEFSKLLMSGEHILWTGKTKKGAGLKARGGNAVSAIYLVFWTGSACWFALDAILSEGFFGLFDVPYIIIGLFLLRRFLVIGEQKYAITDRRVLKYADKKLTAEMLGNIADITVFNAGNNLGCVKYAVKDSAYSNYRYGRSRVHFDSRNGFFGIEDPEQVYRILSDAVYAYTARK